MAVFNAPFSNTRSVVELALAEIIAMARRLPEKNVQMHAGRWDKSAAGSHEVRGRQARHRRLRQHRHPAVGAGGEPRHVRLLLRHRGQAGPRQRAALLHPDRAAGVGGDRHAARGRAGRQPRLLRRGRVRRDAAAVAVPEPVPRLRGRPRGAAPQHRVRAHRRGGRSTSSPPSRRAAATSSSPSCADCRTSSSPRTSAARPRRPSRTSASSSRTSWPSTWPRVPPRSA